MAQVKRTPTDPALEELLEHLRRTRGFDFTGYKRPTLGRRIRRRLDALGIDSYAAYQDFLESTPAEAGELFDSILINVTGFFRDREAWDTLAREHLPQLLDTDRGGNDGGFRVWIAGCSTGQEAYTVAMILAEALGEHEFLRRVKIFATDADEKALDSARLGVYTPKEMEGVPEELAQRYFEATDHKVTFRRDLRRAVIFGRNDLVQDAPISRVDLLVCRNTLIYFNADTQGRILGHFNFALRDEGLMFLGRSEMLLTRGELFEPVDIKLRLFAKVPRRRLGDRLLELTAPAPASARTGDVERLTLAALDAAPIAQVVFDADDKLISANEQGRRLFQATVTGRPPGLRDLDAAIGSLDIRSAVTQARATGAPVDLGIVRWANDGHGQELDVRVTPVVLGGQAAGAAVTFTDVTRFKSLQDELERSKRELEVAYGDLQTSVEELETTNEELQATNEELETTNEELQSTNEELETLNEELESTNEELETINDELGHRTTELHDVNSVLEAILSSLGVGIAVVDRALCVEIWSYRAEDLWGVRSEEVEGHTFTKLDIGLPVAELEHALREVLRELRPREVTLDAVNRRGRPTQCRVSMLPLVVAGKEIRGAIILMEPLEPAA